MPGGSRPRVDAPWVDGWLDTPAGEVPHVARRLSFADHLGALAVRFGVGRGGYQVPPGLYALGAPGRQSPVLVTANYKLTFDRLRSGVGAVEAWVLVLDTRGVNVWCAAGKGTFGTAGLVAGVRSSGLAELVEHRVLLLPQLGAPGVAAHEVQQSTGFRVVYGPVRAGDLPAFLAADMRATPAMRRVRFGLVDRAVLIPVEVRNYAPSALLAAVVALAAAGLANRDWSLARAAADGPSCAAFVLLSFLSIQVLVPLLLPWLPGRWFAVKGLSAALLVWGAAHAWPALAAALFRTPLEQVGWLLVLAAGASYLALQFTGCTTFTSPSGVRREVRATLVAQPAVAALGTLCWLLGRL